MNCVTHRPRNPIWRVSVGVHLERCQCLCMFLYVYVSVFTVNVHAYILSFESGGFLSRCVLSAANIYVCDCMCICQCLQYMYTHRYHDLNLEGFCRGTSRATTIPLKTEIRFKIFGSRDLTIFSFDLLSDGDSVYTRDNFYKNLGTPVKTCVICMGTPVRTCWKFWQSYWARGGKGL